MAKDIFERLQEGQPATTEAATKPQLGKTALKARLKTLLTDVLAAGPAPTKVVYERGRAHGFTKKQIWCARERMKIIAIKETGKPRGRWFLCLGQ